MLSTMSTPARAPEDRADPTSDTTSGPASETTSETTSATAHRLLEAAAEDLDFVYCYGDYIYEGRGSRTYTGSGGTMENPRQHFGGECYSLDDYRRRYAQYKMDTDLQASHAAATA